MKSALAKWRDAIVDYSDTSELTMAKAFWPNGEQPITQAPRISIDQSGTVRLVPAEVDDSMGYRINDAAWSVYNGPIVIAKNSRIDAKSVRYGWAESPLVTVSRPAAN
jgi:hypothetical protein